MLTIAVCDDNPQFANILTKKIRHLCAFNLPDRIECKIAPEFGSANDVLRYLSKYSINILFLDIDMPQTSGFTLAKTLNEKYPDTVIIFVSAYENFVYSSFEFSPFRFLRKSHLEKELPITFQKVIEKCIIDSETLSFQSTEGEVILRVKDILYFEGEKNYYVIHCTSGVNYRCRGTVTAVENIVRKYDFFRIHSAFVINEEHVEFIDDKGFVHMKDGAVLSVSRRKVSDFKESYMNFIRRRVLK